MTAPQSLSAERREEVLAMWDALAAKCEFHDLEQDLVWWPLIAAIDAQHAERTRAEVEKMREAAILQIQAEAAATEDGETLESLHRVIERLRALSIEGTGLKGHQPSCWTIKYEDTEMADEIFMGDGAESAARERFRGQSDSWNCWLLADVDCSFPIEGTGQ